MNLKKYSVLLITVSLTFLTFASCSDDDSSNTSNQEDQLSLLKTIIYTPSLDGYNNANPNLPTTASKRVKYYENGRITSDSIFDASGAFFGNILQTTQGNTVTEVKKLFNNSTAYTNIYKYDSQGRIIEIDRSDNRYFKSVIKYIPNNKIQVSAIMRETEETSSIHEYTTNENGFIDSAYGSQTLTYENGRPILFTEVYDGSNTTLHFSYYNKPVPENMLKTATQVNNIVLLDEKDKGMKLVADHTNHYIKSHDGYNYYDSTFNEKGYIIHTLYSRLGFEGATTETFYYYSE